MALAWTCSCGQAEKANVGIFEYRDVYLPDYNKKDNAALQLNHIDEDWGIWGHNLGSVLPDNPSKQIYAKVNGGVDKDQFCFSNEKLYDYIVDYINNQYTFDENVRFAILPNDNDIVCLCNDCVRLGNSAGNAAPAVFHLIEKLSAEFPQHMFFTSYYSTTTALPDKKMPKNAGVLVSAIDYPLTAGENQQEMKFLELLNQWKEVTDKIYVWDYINNFDDYFTPYPVFNVVQHRLSLYKDAGVNGVFLNGSGNDYSTFGKIKKAVLAKMLEDPSADWKMVLRDYLNKNYPVSGQDIANFIILQENMVERNGVALPMYEGIDVEAKTYLPKREFLDFYNKVVMHKKTAEGSEKEELERLSDAMALTLLEMKRVSGDVTDTEKLKERLRRLIPNGTLYYNEGCWSIAEFLENYEFMENNAEETAETNLLKGVMLKPLTPLDEDYSDISIVTDGLLGIPSNYHDGNLISSADPALTISIPRQPGMKKIKVWMVYNPGFKIGLPEEVYVTVNGVRKAPQVPEKPQKHSGHSILEFDVDGTGDIILTLKKNPEVKTMAIDEIQAF